MTNENVEEYSEYVSEDLTVEEAEVQGQEMPVSLIDFLCANPVQDETEKVVISERLKDFEFEIGAMDKKEYDGYINQ